MIFHSRPQPPAPLPEISPAGRAVSVVAGLALAAASVRPRPNRFLSVLAFGTGAYLAWRGATGRCPITEAVEHYLGEADPPRR